MFTAQLNQILLIQERLAQAGSPETINEEELTAEILSADVPASTRQSTSCFEQQSDQTPKSPGLLP